MGGIWDTKWRLLPFYCQSESGKEGRFLRFSLALLSSDQMGQFDWKKGAVWFHSEAREPLCLLP